MTGYSLVLVTAPSADEAGRLAKKIVEAKLAACVNVVPGVESYYHWEGRLENTKEVLMLLKTKTSLVPELTAYVRAHHPNKVPEVVALDITQGSRPYLDWVGANTLFAKA